MHKIGGLNALVKRNNHYAPVTNATTSYKVGGATGGTSVTAVAVPVSCFTKEVTAVLFGVRSHYIKASIHRVHLLNTPSAISTCTFGMSILPLLVSFF